MGDVLIEKPYHLMRAGEYLYSPARRETRRIVAVWHHPGGATSIRVVDDAPYWFAAGTVGAIEELS
jgi:hypothetical protein